MDVESRRSDRVKECGRDRRKTGIWVDTVYPMVYYEDGSGETRGKGKLGVRERGKRKKGGRAHCEGGSVGSRGCLVFWRLSRDPSIAWREQYMHHMPAPPPRFSL